MALHKYSSSPYPNTLPVNAGRVGKNYCRAMFFCQHGSVPTTRVHGSCPRVVWTDAREHGP